MTDAAVSVEASELRDGIYRSAAGYVAISADGDGWIVVGQDGPALRLVATAMPALRRADRLDREHEAAAALAHVIGKRNGKQLRAFATDHLRELLDETEL